MSEAGVDAIAARTLGTAIEAKDDNFVGRADEVAVGLDRHLVVMNTWAQQSRSMASRPS